MGGFNKILLNIQQAKDQIDLIDIFLQLERPDVAVISEHGLRNNKLNDVNFPDCKLVVCDFSNSERKSRGGLVTLVKKIKMLLN